MVSKYLYHCGVREFHLTLLWDGVAVHECQLLKSMPIRISVLFFLYTHEAHPGENYPHLTSMEQKFKHAHALRDEYGVTRPILVDALDGACHRAYGSMPNMTWVFNRAGAPVYKSDWSGFFECRLCHSLSFRSKRNAAAREFVWHHSTLSAWIIASRTVMASMKALPGVALRLCVNLMRLSKRLPALNIQTLVLILVN